MKIACEVLRTLYDFSNLRQHLLCIFLLIERLVVDVVKLDSVPTLHQYQIALSRVSLIFEPVRLACLTPIYPDDVDLFILSFFELHFGLVTVEHAIYKILAFQFQIQCLMEPTSCMMC